MKRILINGDRACLPIDGMNRVLLEITRSLDSIVEKNKYELIIPANVNREYYDRIKGFKNIKIKKTILPYFKFWSFIFVDVAGLFSHRTVINFCNRNSVFGGGINMLHDIIPIKFYGNKDRKYLKRIERLLNTSDCLIVPSEFTRDDIEKTLNVNCKINVLHNGWQHYPEIEEDNEIFNEYKLIKKGEYYFSLSSISPHKNFKFIYEVAKRSPNRIFVVAGAMNRGPGFDFTKLKNLLFVGRISDQKAKALMMNCRAFIFPSLYEGAGIPPLEALSCNVPVLASDIKVVHEYCGDAVRYFDPDDYDIDIEEVLKEKVSDPKDVLGLLSWKKTAQDLKTIIDSYKEGIV